ncbi:hypothetical protein A2U94_11890 [Bacillus sp. VT 712]|nr:hypothetical protein A2U94_11890 [Bacillus sp. VT 712]
MPCTSVLDNYTMQTWPYWMIVFAALFLNESITFFTIVTAVVVVIAVIVGKNTGVTKKSSASIKQSR